MKRILTAVIIGVLIFAGKAWSTQEKIKDLLVWINLKNIKNSIVETMAKKAFNFFQPEDDPTLAKLFLYPTG